MRQSISELTAFGAPPAPSSRRSDHEHDRSQYTGADFLVWLVDGGAAVFGEDFPVNCPPAAGAGFDQVAADDTLRTVLGDVTVR